MKKNKIVSLSLASILALSLAVPAFASQSSSDEYSVKKDDTLWIISQKYKVPLKSIAEANPQITNKNLIYPGELVRVNLDGSNLTGLTGAACTHQGDLNAKHDKNFGKNKAVKSQTSSNSEESQVLSLVNAERAKNSLSPLTLATDVSNTARLKSEDMAKKGYFDHTSPTYGSPFDMLKSFGISYRTAGENIAKGQRTPSDVMNAWMNSPGHRANILNSGFKEIGIGYCNQGGTTYWTQQFITR